jgi:hypothetical protein
VSRPDRSFAFRLAALELPLTSKDWATASGWGGRRCMVDAQTALVGGWRCAALRAA